MKKQHSPFTLIGKTVIITGASSGIGRQCAVSCDQLGASIVLLGRNMERLNETQSLMQNGSRHLVYSLDLCQYNLVEQILTEVVAKIGKIHGVINSAGISTTLPFKMVTPVKLNEFFQVNVFAAMNLARLVTKKAYISEKGGSIVFISSVMGIIGEVGKSLYGMSKGALISGSRSLALEFAEKKIRFNCVSPGVVTSPMSKDVVYSKDEESFNKIKSYHPLGLGQPEDVANACMFLLSDAAKWITGSNLVVDGGYTAR